MPDPDGRPVFPPDIVVKIKALACELPRESGLPLSRYSNSEIASEAIRRGIVAEISGATIWRWLNQDAIRPWQFRSWIFPRDPRFEEKAGAVLDLYQGLWRGIPLHPDDMVICADEKPSIQARQRKHVPRGPRPRQPMRVEHEHGRRGALCYFAAWDVRHAKLFGHCAPTSGIAPPSTNWSVRSWITTPIDPLLGSLGRRQRLLTPRARLHRAAAAAVAEHRAGASSHPCKLAESDRDLLLHRAAQGPDPERLPRSTGLEAQLFKFQDRYQQLAQPFEWRFTRADLARLLLRLNVSDTLQLSA